MITSQHQATDFLKEFGKLYQNAVSEQQDGTKIAAFTVTLVGSPHTSIRFYNILNMLIVIIQCLFCTVIHLSDQKTFAFLQLVIGL